MTIPIYCLSVEMHPWYDPAPKLLRNLAEHVSARAFIDFILSRRRLHRGYAGHGYIGCGYPAGACHFAVCDSRYPHNA